MELKDFQCHQLKPKNSSAVQGFSARAHQQDDEGLLQSELVLREVYLPGQFSAGRFALNIGLMHVLHQQDQVLQQLAGVDIQLHGTDRNRVAVPVISETWMSQDRYRSTLASCRKLSTINWPLKCGNLEQLG